MVVRDMGFMRRNVGQIILASAIIDDTIGWIIIAITFGLARQETSTGLGLAKASSGRCCFWRSASRSGGAWCSS